jgi:hypothetical protein
MDVIEEIFVKLKSTPFIADRDEQFIFSLPVTVKTIAEDADVGPARARVTVGGVVSTTIALFAPRDPAVAGATKVNVDAVPARSRIDPPLSESEDVATYVRSALVSPA